jgi:hypothetical protein
MRRPYLLEDNRAYIDVLTIHAIESLTNLQLWFPIATGCKRHLFLDAPQL